MSIANKSLIWVARVWFVIWAMPVPIIYFIWKYGGTTTQTVDVTTNSMPLAILIIIIVLSFIMLIFLGSQIIVLGWDYIKNNPLGFVTVVLFSVFISALSFYAMGGIDKLNDLISNSVEQLQTDMTIWRGSLKVILYYQLIGFVGGLLGFVYEIYIKATT